MQLLLTVGTAWQNVNGATGKDGNGNDVVISLSSGDNIKIWPHNSSAYFEWYQGSSSPNDNTTATLPIPSGAQSFATYDGTDSFFVRASVEDSKITVIITKGGA